MSGEDGWMSYEYLTPPANWLVELMRPNWNMSHVIRVRDINPAINIAGLFWRMTGIGKQEVPQFMQAIEQSARYRNVSALNCR